MEKRYPLVICDIAIQAMAIEIVELPIKIMVIFEKAGFQMFQKSPLILE